MTFTTIPTSALTAKAATSERMRPRSQEPAPTTHSTTTNGSKSFSESYWRVGISSSNTATSASSPPHSSTSFASRASDSYYYDGLPTGSLVWVIFVALFAWFFLGFLLWKATYSCRAERRFRAHEESVVSDGIAVDTQRESRDGEILPTYEEAQRAALDADNSRMGVALEGQPSRTSVHAASSTSVETSELAADEPDSLLPTRMRQEREPTNSTNA